MTLRIVAGRLLALLVFAWVVVALVNFPVAQLPITIGLSVYAAILFRNPNLWLVVIPALLPVLDLAPWSGRFFFEEFDFCVLTTLGVAFWRGNTDSTTSRLAIALKGAIGLMALSYLVSLFVGLFPLEPLDANAFANYFSHYNSLRVAKGFVWAICLTCLARRGSRVPNGDGDEKRLFALGTVLGLAALNLAVLYERFIFAGVFNFNSDLRAVATFSGLHNGGNDIEAYLVFSAPFIVAWVFNSRLWGRYILGTALFVLTSYSILVTFSRGGYLGFFVAWLTLIPCLILVARAHAALLPSLKVPLFALLLTTVGAAVALPILKGDFIRARFATVALDWQSRVDQLQNTFQMMDSDLVTSLFGMGLGRFPATYLAKQPTKSLPTTYSFEKEPDNSFVHIITGSPLYLGQWIKSKPYQNYVLSMDLRSVNQKASMAVLMCEKQLQKSFRCQSIQFQSNGSGAWEHFERRFNTAEVGGDIGRLAGYFSRRPVELALYSAAFRSVIDVDNVKLADQTGANLISNGDFSNGPDRWFFTVDDLMPWQSSNHWGQVFFEQGWLGLIAFNLFLVCVLVLALVQIRRGDLFAAVSLSGCAGFLVVGLFGSLFDTPRMATLFFFGAILPFLGKETAEVSSFNAAPAQVPQPARRISFSRFALVTLVQGKFARVALGAIIVCTIGLIAEIIYDQSFEELFVDESKLSRLPNPEELPPVKLLGFKYTHPRLPAPIQDEIHRLESENPGYLRSLEDPARNRNRLYTSTLLARIYPGSRDLLAFYRQLIGLDFGFRGNQVKFIALGYDWLYDQWSVEQRKGLQSKLLGGCQYLIKFIREERLSPYNVFLYNSPFQNLVACSLALYGDDPRAEPVMRFTDDLWKNRVLPVWRQVMGRNGGWHEGGEYVHIGIGQAVYQVPAMWRAATGEDFFRTEPGIRGFLDFLIYRVRPDETIFRMGDASHFTPWLAPDYYPLAIEYQYREAYSMRPPRRQPMPTGWPWGPLTTASLYQPDKIPRLPLARLFDGLGLLVSKTDWGPNATYVTFKAGDNFWSHSHLDQGGFTIYKGGALAIDSGLYGPKYGSDHHMNYTYQTIAHNTVTVTDPADTVPAPGEKGPRQIANDGGQRRVGSGWGVEAAPLDLAEWKSKYDIYHTGKIEKVAMEAGIVAAAADLTSAYTNKLSGKGTFSHRTRRVERFWRTFGHDQVSDVIVIFDRVRATDANFRKRWLLHTIEQPQRTDYGFSVVTSPTDKPGYAGGRLQGHVLLPKVADLQVVGGPNSAFLVDGRNYDENGEIAKISAARKGEVEPGEWRIELSAAALQRDDVFLVVLVPTLLSEPAKQRIQLLEQGDLIGCEISIPGRTTRWWFDANRNGALIEIVDASGTKRIDVRGASQ